MAKSTNEFVSDLLTFFIWPSQQPWQKAREKGQYEKHL